MTATGYTLACNRRLLALLLGLAVAACQPNSTPTTPAPQPAAMVEAYLAAVAGASPDRGWSLLHPDVRATMFDNNLAHYVESAAQAEWLSFSWQVLRARADDPSLHFVELSVENVPDFLKQPISNEWLMWVDGGIGTMAVRIPFAGRPGGIWSGGG